jgi:hypothetical protein
MPRIIQVAPDGSGRYIAVDRDGDFWRGETKRQEQGGEEYIQWRTRRLAAATCEPSGRVIAR